MEIRIYDKAYNPLTTLLISRTESDFNNLQYRDNFMQVGDASFSMRLDNVKTSLTNLRHYNLVEICDDDGTKQWTGVIVYRQVLFNIVNVTCFGMLHLLTQRLTAADDDYTDTAANIVTALLNATNGASNTMITAGTIDDPANIEITFNQASVFDALRRIADSSGGQFRLNPDRSLDFRALIGDDLSDDVIFQYRLGLIAGSNVLKFQVEDDGKKITTTTYGESGGFTSTQTDSALASEFGLLEDFKNFREFDDQTSLDNATAGNNKGSELSPLLELSPKVADNFRVGDTVKVILENRLVNINNNYQITEKAVRVKGGNQKQITVRVISNTSDFFKQIRDMKRDIDLLNRSV